MIFLIVLLSMVCVLFGGCACQSESMAVSPYDMSERLITISANSSIEDIASTVVYAVVGIETESSIGSGVCVGSGGYILTNSHVVHDSLDIVLHLYDGSMIYADIVYEDTVLDLAILRAEKSMPYLKLADVSDLQVGEDVLAVGTPLSLTLAHSFTKGIVSALNRTLRVDSSSGLGYMQGMIQHDASLNSGNSGGPLLNTSGEIVGINTLKISGGDGVGFAIPTKAFASILTSVVGDVEYDTPYIGLFGYDASIELGVREGSPSGFYVVDVALDSPAVSYIEKGSIITAFNGVTISNALDFRHELYKCEALDKVAISYVLDGVEYDVTMTLGSKA